MALMSPHSPTMARKYDGAERFSDHGYLVLGDIIPAGTISRLREYLSSRIPDVLDRLSAELGEIVTDIPAVVDRTKRDGRFQNLSAAAKSILSGHFPLEVRLSQELWEIPRQPAFRQMLEGILGTELFMHMPPAARFVLPGNIHAGVPAHQDVTYGGHMSDFITVWVPLVDIDSECGGLAIFEGSHLSDMEAPAPDGAFWFNSVPTSQFRRIECPVKAGGAIVMHKLLVHESIANRSARPRLSIDYRFFSGANTSRKHHLDLQTWQVIAPRAR